MLEDQIMPTKKHGNALTVHFDLYASSGAEF